MSPTQKMVLVTERPLLSRKFSMLLTAAGLAPEHHVLPLTALPSGLRREANQLIVIATDPFPASEVLADLRKSAPQSRFIIWCRRVTPQLVQAAMEADFDGLLSRRLPLQEAAEVLLRICGGDRQFRFDSDDEVDKMRDSRLTPREQLVAALAMSGQRNREIAEFLRIAEGSVKVCLNRVYWKIGARNRDELAHLAKDLIEPRAPRRRAAPLPLSDEKSFDNLWMFMGDMPNTQAKEKAMIQLNVSEQQLFDIIMALYAVRDTDKDGRNPAMRKRLDLLLDALHAKFDLEVMPERTTELPAADLTLVADAARQAR
jgi:DNA-binding NarL/FixJ family response regulator